MIFSTESALWAAAAVNLGLFLWATVQAEGAEGLMKASVYDEDRIYQRLRLRLWLAFQGISALKIVVLLSIIGFSKQ